MLNPSHSARHFTEACVSTFYCMGLSTLPTLGWTLVHKHFTLNHTWWTLWLYKSELILAYGQHNLGLCWGQRPPNWAFGPLKGGFCPLGPVFGPSAHFRPRWGIHRHTNKQTNKLFINICQYDSSNGHSKLLNLITKGIKILVAREGSKCPPIGKCARCPNWEGKLGFFA